MTVTEAQNRFVNAIFERSYQTDIVFRPGERTGASTDDVIEFDDFRPSAAEVRAWKDACGADGRLELTAGLTAPVQLQGNA